VLQRDSLPPFAEGLTMIQPDAGSPEFWAAHAPDRPAVIDGDTVLTYGQWNDAADRVAEGLAQLRLGQGDRVGMRFRLCTQWFVIQRALQKLGVAQVAVNWRLTPDEAVYILQDSGAKGLACNDADAGGWAGHDVGLLITVGQPADSAGVRYEDLLETPCPNPRFGPARPSLVLYTSGTTGRPRGVPPLNPAEVTDLDRLVRYAASVSSVPPAPDGVTSLLTMPIHHGAGPQIAALTCGRGGTVVVLDPYRPEEALALIDKHSVQFWIAVPTMLLRIQKLPEDVLSRYDLSSLTSVSVGAAPVPQSLKKWIIDRLGDDVLWESYGASEAGMISYTEPQHQLTKPGTSGRPYDGVEIAIIDDHWNRLPRNEVGEIAVSTPTVLRNYLGGPALGEDVVKDGFYRTGDVGYLDDDGFLFITDRIKDMIVAGGVNIYPAEIEKAIVSHPRVIDAAVIGVPHDDFGEQPLAFIVADQQSPPTEQELLDHLDGRLAKYKWPRHFVFVDDLPCNPTGKILKNELRQQFWAGRQRQV
jgi:long-chain acyl-CoA synthetase